MFCEKCGHKIEDNEFYCPQCGNKVREEESEKQSAILINKIKDKGKKYLQITKSFIVKNKKVLGLSTAFLIILSIGFLLFETFYDFTKINWDYKKGDTSLNISTSETLELFVLAYDKEKKKIEDIEFDANAGEIKSNGASVKWTLPKEPGTYTIKASTKAGKKITKTVQVVDIEGEKPLTGTLEEKLDEDKLDSDQDGILDREERTYGTDPHSKDTDEDGLSDYYEINISKTDPLKSDTDGDGLNDGDELDLGLDPLKTDSKNDQIRDGQRTLNYQIEDDQNKVILEITGKGNIASTTIDVVENDTFQEMDGLIGKIYNFYSKGTIDKVNVKINYGQEDLDGKNITEDNLTLYYFDEELKKLEPIPTTVDKESKEVTATIDHFSKYLIGDRNIVLENKEADLLFVIDNSISMYTEEQMVERGYKSTRGHTGNDKGFKRIILTDKLIDMFSGSYRFSISEFASTYKNLAKFTEKKSEVKTALNKMKEKFQVELNGTNIVDALNRGMKEFTEENNNHYLILLTDGKDTNSSLSRRKDDIIHTAKEKEIKICVIGLGSQVDSSDLNEIATATGCNYYNASRADALDEIYALLGASINYNYIDTDNDQKVDGMIQENSGFLVNRDGFSFENFHSSTAEGHCYGMATFAMEYYKKTLPLKMGEKNNNSFVVKYIKRMDLSADGYDLSNTYFEDYNNLYDFKISTKELSYLLEKPAKDYRDRITDDVLMINKKYYDKLEKMGVDFIYKKYKGEGYNKYQSALLNLEKLNKNDYVTEDEKELLNAIWRLFILQANDKSVSFDSEPDAAFSELMNKLKEGSPQVLVINGNHAINAIKFIQDINDANKFKIEVYDNNFPGKTKYITMTRSKFSKIQLNYTAWVNEYEYKFSYDQNGDGEDEKTTVSVSLPAIE